MLKTKEVISWLKKAEGDLLAAQIIMKKRTLYWVVCLHCQQAAEKALKAAQIYFLNDFQKGHDLIVLLKLLEGKVDTAIIRADVNDLTDYYLTSRYPGTKESELTLKDAHSAHKKAQKIFKFIKDKIQED